MCSFGEVDMEGQAQSGVGLTTLHRHIRALQRGPVPLPHVLLHPMRPEEVGEF